MAELYLPGRHKAVHVAVHLFSLSCASYLPGQATVDVACRLEGICHVPWLARTTRPLFPVHASPNKQNTSGLQVLPKT